MFCAHFHRLRIDFFAQCADNRSSHRTAADNAYRDFFHIESIRHIRLALKKLIINDRPYAPPFSQTHIKHRFSHNFRNHIFDAVSKSEIRVSRPPDILQQFFFIGKKERAAFLSRRKIFKRSVRTLCKKERDAVRRRKFGRFEFRLDAPGTERIRRTDRNRFSKRRDIGYRRNEFCVFVRLGIIGVNTVDVAE